MSSRTAPPSPTSSSAPVRLKAYTAWALGKPLVPHPLFTPALCHQDHPTNTPPSTLNNVWWESVCEDAATFKQESGTSYVNGGGAFNAEDKVFQFNGRGDVIISDFYAENYGKLVRSCGNCDGNGGPRNVVVEDSVAVDGGVLCGINTNYGDTCAISNTCQNDGKSCDRYEGNDDGSEPEKIGSGPDGEFCTVEGLTEDC